MTRRPPACRHQLRRAPGRVTLAAMVTKRQLGLLLMAGGLGLLALVFGIDLVRSGEWQGMGPYQQIGTAAGVIMVLVGLSLLPLGERPA